MSVELKNLRIASPCPASWESMKGDDRVRFCDLCNLNVYDISQLTRSEAAALIAQAEGRLCARLYRRADGTIITKDCPVGLRAIRRHVARATGAVFATLMSLCSIVAGQKPSDKDKSSCRKQVTITRKAGDSTGEDGVLSGTILDPVGAVVPGAKIAITGRKSSRLTTESNNNGQFRVSGLPPGTYNLVIEYSGFKKLSVIDIVLSAKQAVSLQVLLELDGKTETVGLLMSAPLIEPGKLVINENMIQRIPR